MALALTTTLSNTITKSELDDNFASIQAKFNGGIDNSDIRASAGIAISKLAAAKEYVTVVLSNPAYTWGSTGATIAIAPLPGLSGTQANWTLVSASWHISDTGDNSATIDVALGHYDENGDLQDDTVLVNENDMTVISDDKGNAGQCNLVATGVDYHESVSRHLILRQGDDAGNAIGTVHVGVTLLLERDIQS